MRYIELQENARRNTRRLVLLFSATVAAVVFELYLVMRPTGESAPRTAADELMAFLSVAVWVVPFIGVCAAFRAFSLREGGPAVARMVGGREIPAATGVPEERTLRNVVEEMAIAAALPIPAVFVLDDEPGMNAFAAGLTPANAAVAVTRGALHGLSREELQGVVAHEFAHIRNGDMRLDTWLVTSSSGSSRSA